MNWKNKFKFQYLFFLILFLISIFFIYKFSDEKLSSKAHELLIMDGHTNRSLRQKLDNSTIASRLPKDSIFDHQMQVELLEKQYSEFKESIQKLKNSNSQKELIFLTLSDQLESALVGLYSLNPMKLMALNLDIVIFCLKEMNSLAIPISSFVKSQVQSLESRSLFLRASRFHAQSILGSIDVLRRSKIFVNPAVHLIQKQRLINLMAEISQNQQFKLAPLSTENSWLWPQQLELIYAHFFRQMIYDPKIDLKAQINELKSHIK